MAQFIIDTNKISNVRTNVTNKVLPKINTSYNTVVSVKSNLPSSVLWRKWNNYNLNSLANDIENINNDIIKLSNTLYKAIERMDNAEKIINKWWKLKKDVVDGGKVVKVKTKKIKSDLEDTYKAVSTWFNDTANKVYDTGCEVVEKVENWVENLTWEDVENFFKTTAATIVVAFQSLLKGLLLLLQAIVDLALIVGTIVITPFTALADGVNYLITGETGGYTSYYWNGAMEMVCGVSSLVATCGNWLNENNPDWVKENSLIEAGGMIDQIIQGIGYMVGIIGITVATFGTATPAALACTAGSLGFATGTAEAWEQGKDAFEGLIMGTIKGGWEAFQYYIGGKIGTAVFGKITNNIVNPILQKVVISGLRVLADSATGAIEVPFQSLVLTLDTRLDNIEGNELSLKEAWNETGGWEAVGVQTIIAGFGSVFGEVLDFGKAGRKAYKNKTSLSDELGNIYVDDINTTKLNKENPFGSKKTDIKPDDVTDKVEDVIDDSEIDVKNAKNVVEQVADTVEQVVEQVEETVEELIDDSNVIAKNVDNIVADADIVSENVESVIEEVKDTLENVLKNDLDNNVVSDGDIAMANYRAGKGTFTSFKFDDASKLPDLDSNFWKNIEHPEQTFVYVDGKNMTFNDALIYRQSYESSIKHIDIGKIDNLAMENLDYADIGIAEAAAAKFASSAKRYVYTDTNDFIGLNKRISDNGLYHFTDATDAIMDSGYIKATAEGWSLKAIGDKIAGKSYGKPKTFFFEGIPEVGAFATNIDTIPLKTTAVKINPTSDVLNSPNLRIRNLDDGAITWDGRFDLTDQKVSKQYFVLTVDEGELKYINVPESVYNSYDNTPAGKQLAEFISNKKNIQTIKNDYLVNTSLKGTNAQISNNSKIISLYDRSKAILKDKAGSLDSFKLKSSSGDANLKANELNELMDNNLKSNPSLKRFNNARVFSNDYEVAIKYEDPKQYLYCKLKDLADSTGDSIFQKRLQYFRGKRNIDKNYGELYNVIYPYLDANDMDVLSKMNLNSYNSRFTSLDQEEMFLYSRATGPALAAYERGTSCEWTRTDGTTTIYNGTNKNSIQDLINFHGRKKYGLDVIDIDEYVERIDNIIKKAPPLEEDTILYRGVNSLFFDGNELDVTNLKVGQIINDKATISTSLLKDKAYTQNDIMLEILAPKGTKGAYIESFVGGYGQQEFLLGRNTTFKVISQPDVDPITGKTTIKVEILPPDTLLTKLKNTGANIIDKFKSKFIDSSNKNNFTTELEENVGTKFTGNHTEKLVGDYPNKVIDSNNVIDKMNLRKFNNNDTINKYDKLFNNFDDGVEINEFIDKLERRNLLSVFDSSIKDIDELYARGQGPRVVQHDVDHVERVMLFAMYMGDELQLSGKDMGVLIQAAKHHDIGVYNGHPGHAQLSAMEAIKALENNYPQSEINKIAAVIDYHEVIKREESFERFSQICAKYNVPESEQKSLFNVANILKDADAIDRTRFKRNLDTSYFRNVNEANKLVKTSYQMQEIRGKIALEQKINDNAFTPEQVEQIKFYREQGVPDYVIEQSYETYHMWGDKVNGRYFNTPDAMIKNWMQGAIYS